MMTVTTTMMIKLIIMMASYLEHVVRNTAILKVS